MPSLDDAINNAIERRGKKGKEAQTFLEQFKELAFAFEPTEEDLGHLFGAPKSPQTEGGGGDSGLPPKTVKAVQLAREQKARQGPEARRIAMASDAASPQTEGKTLVEKFVELALVAQESEEAGVSGVSEKAKHAVQLARKQKASQAGAFGNEAAFQKGRAEQGRFSSFTTAERPSFPLTRSKKGGKEAKEKILSLSPRNKKLGDILSGGEVNLHFEKGAGGPSGRILADNPLSGQDTVRIPVGFGRTAVVSGTKGSRERGLGFRLLDARNLVVGAAFGKSEAKKARKKGFGSNIAAAARARQARQRAKSKSKKRDRR